MRFDPPCSQTMTGAGPVVSAGAQTFSVRQSSPVGSGAPPMETMSTTSAGPA